MIIGISPTVDFAFKHLYGRERTRPLLTDLVDSILTPDLKVRELDLLNPYNPKETLDDKLSILDIKARDVLGRQFNLEMQMLAFRFYEKRILYYWSKFHQHQLHEGQDYLDLKPTISISFLDHVLFPKVPEHHLRFRLIETSRYFPFSEDIEFHVLELPKFTKSASELTSRLDTWLYFLRYAEKIDTDAVPPTLRTPTVLWALEELKMLAQTDQERDRYEARRKAQLDYNTGLRVARKEGRDEGEKIGIIHLCERLLGRPETPTEDLVDLPPEELARVAEERQAQVQRPQ